LRYSGPSENYSINRHPNPASTKSPAMKTETLTSARNPLVKEVRRAAARGTLTESGLCVAEGMHLLEEALRSGCEVTAVLASERVSETIAVEPLAARVHLLPERLFRELATTETSQGVIALVRPPRWSLDQFAADRALWVVLDGVQEPGNAGAIVRAGEAFGATGAVFLKGTVNPYNPKSLRASAGSMFRLPCVHNIEDAAFVATVHRNDIHLFGMFPQGSVPVYEADLRQPCAILIGSEGHGVRAELSSAATALRIPTSGVESLNAAVAAGIVLYEARRQRGTG
jgi:TrmH family RNA methyltransferase